MNISKKCLTKEMRASILVRYVIGSDIWLHGFGNISASYLSDIHFERLAYGYTTDSIIGMIFVVWCIFKLDCYVTFCHACLILIVADYIIHMERKVVSWSWGVFDITMTSEFSGHVQVN